eukprot:68869-Chlamydomonas_euryale.AAC.1
MSTFVHTLSCGSSFAWSRSCSHVPTQTVTSAPLAATADCTRPRSVRRQGAPSPGRMLETDRSTWCASARGGVGGEGSKIKLCT